MTSLEDLKADGVKFLTYSVSANHIKPINKVISDNMDSVDYNFPDKAGVSTFPIYLDPYGTRVFVTEDNELIIQNEEGSEVAQGIIQLMETEQIQGERR